MSQASALYQLQQLEQAIAQGEKRLTEIDAALNEDSRVRAARAAQEAATAALSPLRAKVRDLELESQSTQQKAAATEQQLYSGSVKNPKAMQEMEQEIAALKQRFGQLEERLLEAMMNLEEGEAALDEASEALAAALGEAQQQHGDLLAEQAALHDRLAELRAQHTAALTPITPASLKAYQTLKPRRGGQPVALLQGLSCLACGVEQTTTLAQEARRGDKLVTCTNCGRILAMK